VARQKAFVETIEPSEDALSVEEVVKLFSTAFGHVYALKVVDKLVVNSLTHELTSAEVTTVFRRTSARSSGASRTSTGRSSITLGSFLNGSKAR